MGGGFSVIYHLCLWTRLANRVQLILFSGEAHNEQNPLSAMQSISLANRIYADKSLAIEFHGSQHIRNSMFGAQVVKGWHCGSFPPIKGSAQYRARKTPKFVCTPHLKNEVLR